MKPRIDQTSRVSVLVPAVLLLGVLLPLLYFLSVGPVARVYRHEGELPAAALAFYRPLTQLSHRSSSFRWLVKEYVELWVDDA